MSEFSPGPVKDDETLLSVVTSKNFISNGYIEPTLFESRMSNGISTDRKNYTTLTDYDMRAEKLVEENPKKSNYGSIALLVGGIRKINLEGQRAIAVYDTALRENRSHAEIACTEVPPAGTQSRKKLRASLRRKVLDATLHGGRVLSSSALFGCDAATSGTTTIGDPSANKVGGDQI